MQLFLIWDGWSDRGVWLLCKKKMLAVEKFPHSVNKKELKISWDEGVLLFL